MILNLAFVFGAAVLAPQGRLDTAAVLTGVAILAPLRFRLDVLWVVLWGTALGLLRLLEG